jgi:hypothetical protein
MCQNKAQAGMIDTLVLTLSISVIMVSSISFGGSHIQQSVTREEGSYSAAMMLSLLNYRNSSYGSYNNTHNLSIADAIGAYYCEDNVIYRHELEEVIGWFLNMSVKPGYLYIFYSGGSRGGNDKYLWQWNGQKDVCGKYMSIKVSDLKLHCHMDNYTAPMIGIWPQWKKLPPMGACD